MFNGIKRNNLTGEMEIFKNGLKRGTLNGNKIYNTFKTPVGYEKNGKFFDNLHFEKKNIWDLFV